MPKVTSTRFATDVTRDVFVDESSSHWSLAQFPLTKLTYGGPWCRAYTKFVGEPAAELLDAIITGLCSTPGITESQRTKVRTEVMAMEYRYDYLFRGEVGIDDEVEFRTQRGVPEDKVLRARWTPPQEDCVKILAVVNSPSRDQVAEVVETLVEGGVDTNIYVAKSGCWIPFPSCTGDVPNLSEINDVHLDKILEGVAEACRERDSELKDKTKRFKDLAKAGEKARLLEFHLERGGTEEDFKYEDRDGNPGGSSVEPFERVCIRDPEEGNQIVVFTVADRVTPEMKRREELRFINYIAYACLSKTNLDAVRYNIREVIRIQTSDMACGLPVDKVVDAAFDKFCEAVTLNTFLAFWASERENLFNTWYAEARELLGSTVDWCPEMTFFSFIAFVPTADTSTEKMDVYKKTINNCSSVYSTSGNFGKWICLNPDVSKMEVSYHDKKRAEWHKDRIAASQELSSLKTKVTAEETIRLDEQSGAPPAPACITDFN